MIDSFKSQSFHEQIRSARPVGLLALFLAWTVVACLCYARFYFQALASGSRPASWQFLLWFACFYPWALLAPVVFRMESRFPMSWSRVGLKHLSILLAAALPTSWLALNLHLIFAFLFESLLRLPVEPLRIIWAITPRPLSPVEFCYHLIPYWTSIGASYVLRRLAQLHERERETARLALEKSQLESSLRLAELEALRMKLNPHFLFNTLQNISVLAADDPRAAILMLTRLGDLLRASFRKDCQQEIPLHAELALTRAYLDIERVRFQDRLSVHVDVAPGSESALVPTFLLQPLVENAIKHGLAGCNPSGRIQIRSTLQPERLILTVADNGSGISAQGLQDLHMGVGLGATFERLHRLYPQQHELSVRNVEEGGTEVRVAIPFRVAGPFAGAAHAQAASLYR